MHVEIINNKPGNVVHEENGNRRNNAVINKTGLKSMHANFYSSSIVPSSLAPWDYGVSFFNNGRQLVEPVVLQVEMIVGHQSGIAGHYTNMCRKISSLGICL